MLRRSLLTVLLVTLLAAPTRARADQPPPVAPAATETEAYGAGILLVDGLSIALMFGGLSLTGDPPSLLLGLSAFVTLPALVHHYEGNDGAIITSVVGRLVLPAAGGLIGWATHDDHRADDDGLDDLFAIVGGTMIGMGTAMVYDWFVLARRPVPRRSGPSYGVALAPRAEGGMTLSLGGTF